MTPPFGLCLPCRCVRVIDGDTVVISLPGSYREWHIRLLECWAPEKSTSEGKQATEFLLNLLDDADSLAVFVPAPNDPIRLLASITTFERVLGRLFLPDGHDVSTVMVAHGLATTEKPVKSAS